ncbi:hypothetical protein EVAR_13968_1 [Eumeta japonica]|uniref:Mos1 transposase HTH domain-containing protein n=1 Tax=Eumeta variegata TaxID=151549 RepID=A0A4C1U9E7_EUMVA|nr:hypothetical protein EVAR_13968_1 [Eumeta japonica]
MLITGTASSKRNVSPLRLEYARRPRPTAPTWTHSEVATERRVAKSLLNVQAKPYSKLADLPFIDLRGERRACAVSTFTASDNKVYDPTVGVGGHKAGLWLAFHDEAPTLATVYNWFNKIKRGRTNLTDDLREGRPSTAMTEDIMTDL